MKIAALASGSKCNCTYIESEKSAILIDCGLSAKQAILRLEALGVNPNKLKGIVITHEHGDHIRGISVLSRKLSIPVYANLKTSRAFKNIYKLERFSTGQDFCIDDIDLHPFSVVHDAADPVAFEVVSSGVKHVQLTDLGRITKLVRNATQNCNSLILESNYDQQSLNDCSYPWQLKQRISSSKGHLSNDDAAIFLSEQKNSDLKHVILGHLSENSNTPELAMATAANFNDFSRFTSIQCGSVTQSTELLSL